MVGLCLNFLGISGIIWERRRFGAEEVTVSNLDWSKCDAVESIPGKVSGAWVFKDTRTPVQAVFANLQAGATVDEVMEWFPVTREQIDAALGFVVQSLEKEPSYG